MIKATEFTSTGAPLSKTFSLAENGDLVKQGGGVLARGTFRVLEFQTIADFHAHLS